MIISLVYFWKLSLAFNHEYLCEFFTKFKDQWQFWNLLAMWILKLSFIFMINEELTEIFKVKGKAQFPKIYRIYDQDCIFYFSWHIFRISIHHHAMATNVTNLQRHPLLFRVQSLALLQLRFWDSLFSISSSSSLTSKSSFLTSIFSTLAGQFSLWSVWIFIVWLRWFFVSVSNLLRN